MCTIAITVKLNVNDMQKKASLKFQTIKKEKLQDLHEGNKKLLK